MKPAPFSYHAPATVEEALALFAAHPDARPLAGGQSLMPMLNMRLATPAHVIDLNGIDTLAYIREEGAELAIGAMTRQRDLEFSPLIARRLPLMAEAILQLGHRQTRNRGTIGGSLCQLDPSAELVAVARAYDAVLVARGGGADARGERRIAMADFAAGYMTPALDPGELLVELRFTPWPEASGWGFVEFARRHGDFAIVSAAALLEPDGAGHIARASLTLGGVAAAPLRLEAAERMLAGAVPTPEALTAAAQSAAGIDALEDPTYPAWYRRKLAVALARRALTAAAQRMKR